ncbi:GtrA family protein [Actinoplanes regularis]|uniref:GtrA family protein n=1 Tax=Actinoplanes regularis TaxID=52697 RepID=UPI0024A305D5|nr:GtrA family protein [Actinoplanes regularis]GLW27330.1 hypothetical protein Areg01_02710 [Actinoplanes regularis]
MSSVSGRLARPPAWNATVPRQILWFMLVGALSTVLQTLVYVSAREIVAATWASWIALLVVTPANTEAHRRITFNVTTNAVGRLHWEAGLTSVVVYVANLFVSPWFASMAGPHPSALTESMILALTGSLIGGVRYLILRGWVFSARRHARADAPAPEPAGTATRTGSVAARPVPAAGNTVIARLSPSRPADAQRYSPRRHPVRLRANAVPATAGPVHSVTSPAGAGPATSPATDGFSLAVLACLGTMAPIPTGRLCLGQPNAGTLNRRPRGRIRAWHRNRRQHLTARS